VRPAAQAQAEPAQANAVGNLSDHDEDKRSRGVRKGEQAAADRGDGKAVENQRSRVIGEAFPFEHDDEPAWNAQPANNGERRNHVGGRHNGAEHETDRERDVEQPVRHCCDRTGGEDDTTDRQQRDRPQIETKLAPAHGDARRVDQRRQDPE
jgi:hypothetical protein